MAKKNPLIFGLIGFPVKHSFSPAMHNAAFKELGINAKYKLFEIKPEELEGFFSSLEEKGIHGLNVTIPHKEKVLDFVELDRESFYLTEIKAVNTIVIGNNIRKGFNTDIPGFRRDLAEKNGKPENKQIAILGAGGASRAVAYALAADKARKITIYDIDKSKSQNIVDLIKKLFPKFDITAVETIEQLKIQEKDLLINTTPVGMKNTDPCLITTEMLHKNLFVYDLIYNPPETKLLALAKQAHIKNSNGLGMLLYQGVLAFTHFTGKSGPVGIMRQVLMDEMKKCESQTMRRY